jgi:hypothetical protein
LPSLSPAPQFCARPPRKRKGIISNSSIGLVDRCVARGAPCGAAAAAAYCRSRDFNQAGSYRKVKREEITGAVPTGTSGGCRDGACDAFVAIECTR